LRILLFAASFPPPAVGGSIEYLYNIFKNMPPQSVTINTANAFSKQAVIFDKSFPQRLIRNNFIHHPVEAYKRCKWRRAWQYIAWPAVAFWLILKQRPDIVHIGEGNTTGIAALLSNKLLKIPYLHYVYAEEILLYRSNWLRNKLFWVAVRGAQAVVTVSEYSRHLLIAGGVLPERIHKLVPAVGVEKCMKVTSEQVGSIRQRYGLENNHVLLTVGALKERKGQATVIEALPKIISHYPNVKYVMAGSGEQEVALHQRTHDLGLGAHVVFAGRIDNEELNCLYEICDMFIMPHRQVPSTLDTEGCPTVFLEASAHGKPVIGGNAGGVADAILDGRTGFIIEGTDANAIATTVCTLLGNSDLSKRMGQAGRENVHNLDPARNATVVWSISEGVVINRKRCSSTRK
jgi:phosphatidylinositol alpha-1,6-mannosyltransferase